MSRFCGPRGLIFGLLWLTLLVGAGCSRPSGWRSDEAAAQAEHPVPFRDDKRTAPPADPGAAPSTQQDPKKSSTELPFHEPKNLPAGTMLTVRLKSLLSAQNPEGNDPFEALVDKAVVIDGNTLVPRGAPVVGRVESARSSHIKRNRGYVRLVLDSIHVAGLDLPVQTASLFAREAPQDSPVTTVRLEKGRRLTFRLTEPLYISSQRALVEH